MINADIKVETILQVTRVPSEQGAGMRVLLLRCKDATGRELTISLPGSDMPALAAAIKEPLRS